MSAQPAPIPQEQVGKGTAGVNADVHEFTLPESPERSRRQYTVQDASGHMMRNIQQTAFSTARDSLQGCVVSAIIKHSHALRDKKATPQNIQRNAVPSGRSAVF